MVSYELTTRQMTREAGLNPCCSGQWSRTFAHGKRKMLVMSVLILIVVDNGLVHNHLAMNICEAIVLILIVVDNGLVLLATFSDIV